MNKANRQDAIASDLPRKASYVPFHPAERFRLAQLRVRQAGILSRRRQGRARADGGVR